MAELDPFAQKLLQDYSAARSGAGSVEPKLDAFAQQLLDEHTGSAPRSAAAPAPHDPAADRWGFLRHAIDAAVYGKGTDAPQREARAAWEKENPEEARAAWALGRSTPAFLASTILGRAILSGAEALGATGTGEFLTGTGGSNVLTRAASLSTAGAGQGALSAGYGQAMGEPESVLGAPSQVVSRGLCWAQLLRP